MTSYKYTCEVCLKEKERRPSLEDHVCPTCGTKQDRLSKLPEIVLDATNGVVKDKTALREALEGLPRLVRSAFFSIAKRVVFECPSCHETRNESVSSYLKHDSCRFCESVRKKREKYDGKTYDLERSRATCLERYGVASASKTKSVQEKRLKTVRERYGDDYCNGSKARETNAAKRLKKSHALRKPYDPTVGTTPRSDSRRGRESRQKNLGR